MSACRGDVVCIHVNGVPADILCSKGDRIGFQYQGAVTELDYRAIEPDPRSQDYAGIRRRVLLQQCREYMRREFPRRKIGHNKSAFTVKEPPNWATLSMAAASLLITEEGCRSVKFATLTHGHHLLYTEIAKGN